MLDEMTWEQFAAWQAFTETDPMPEDRADVRHGIQASLFANANRDPKRRPQPFKPADFIPKYHEAKKRKPLTDPVEWRRLKQGLSDLPG